MSEMKTLKFPGDAEPREIVDAKAREDISKLSEKMLTEESDPTVPAWAKAAAKPSYTASDVGADPSGTADAKVAAHNTAADAHNDIRLLISGLTDRINALADSDDTTLDQMSEVVAYIKANRELIASITTDKVSVTDIVNDLVTNVANKPLSAAQGVALKAMINAITVPAIDNTLTKSGAAADAKAVGDAISSLSEEIVTTTESKVSEHNTGADTHSDIRLLISGLTDRLNALADSDDTTLDQLSEVVAYIKSNRGLIDAITTSKVSVADIIDNLTTNVANKPLSAAQGVALKALIDAISVPDKLPNPNALTFTGSVEGIYDGSLPLTVDIPSGGGDGNREWTLLSTVEVGEDELAAFLTTPTANQMEGYKEMLCIFTSQTKGSDGSEVTSTQALRPFVVDVAGSADSSRISGDCVNSVGSTTSARTALLYITTIANYLSGYITNISANINSFVNVKNSAQVFDKLPQIKMSNNGWKYYCYGTKLEVYVR